MQLQNVQITLLQLFNIVFTLFITCNFTGCSDILKHMVKFVRGKITVTNRTFGYSKDAFGSQPGCKFHDSVSWKENQRNPNHEPLANYWLVDIFKTNQTNQTLQ